MAIYLDYNATAPLRPAAQTAMADAMALAGNPSSVHRYGRDARRMLDTARAALADQLGVPPAALTFTGSASEANGTVLASALREGRHLIVSAVEHDSVLWTTAAGPGEPAVANMVPVDGDGRLAIDALDAQLASHAPGSCLVSVMAVNNETGVVQPIDAVAEVAQRHGALLHCDAVQAAGKLPLAELLAHADYATLSGHKAGGPAGVGVLVSTAPFAPLVRGGGQEGRRRAGTENVIGIAGSVAALAAADGEAHDHGLQQRWRSWQHDLEAAITAARPDAMVYGAAASRVATTSCIAMPGRAAETQVIAFDLEGFAVSAGAACSSGKVTRSHVLSAMGADARADDALRISFGWASTEAELQRFAWAWIALARRGALPRLA